MATINLSKDNFEKTVAENAIVLVDFWASWCSPCRAFAPVFEASSEKHADIVFAKVNTEEQQELAGYFEVSSIPTLMIFRDQVLLFAQPGAVPAKVLDELISKVREIDMSEVHAEIAKAKAEQGAEEEPVQS